MTLSLTPAGQDLVGRVVAWREHELARIMNKLPAGIRMQVASTLQLLVDVAGEEYGTISRSLVPV